MFSATRARLTGNTLPNFGGGNVSYDSLSAAMADLATYAITGPPQTGGTLTLGGTSIGPYDYLIANGDTISSFSNSTWFTGTDDRIALIVIKGNVTLDSGVVFQPAQRKLLTAIYVAGNAVINGTISMTRRGGKTTGAQPNVRLANTWSSLKVGNSSTVYTENGEEVIIEGTGAAGASGVTIASGASNYSVGSVGASATQPEFEDPSPTPAYDPRALLRTGGGGSGGITTRGEPAPSAYTSGAGAAGGSFTGGSGGGGADLFPPWNGGISATPYGGAGGGYSGNGNPSGVGNTKPDGTGGVIVVMTAGTLTGSGNIEANGGDTYEGISGTGGASGGGIVALFSNGHSAISASANGGIAEFPLPAINFAVGGNGGNGSVYRFDW